MINTSGTQYSSREHGKVMDTDTVYRTEEAHYPSHDFFFSNIVTFNKTLVHFTDLC